MSGINKNPVWKEVDHPDGSKSLVIFYRDMPKLKKVIDIVGDIYIITEKYKKVKNITFQVSDKHLGIFLSTLTFTELDDQNFRKEFDDNDRKMAEEIKVYMKEFIN